VSTITKTDIAAWARLRKWADPDLGRSVSISFPWRKPGGTLIPYIVYLGTKSEPRGGMGRGQTLAAATRRAFNALNDSRGGY